MTEIKISLLNNGEIDIYAAGLADWCMRHKKRLEICLKSAIEDPFAIPASQDDDVKPTVILCKPSELEDARRIMEGAE